MEERLNWKGKEPEPTCGTTSSIGCIDCQFFAIELVYCLFGMHRALVLYCCIMNGTVFVQEIWYSFLTEDWLFSRCQSTFMTSMSIYATHPSILLGQTKDKSFPLDQKMRGECTLHILSKTASAFTQQRLHSLKKQSFFHQCLIFQWWTVCVLHLRDI